jgi:hypothetical protein
MKNHEIRVHVVVTIFIISSLEVLLRLFNHRKFSKIAQGADIFFYRSNQRQKEISEGYEFLQDNARNCNSIYIQGATGWETFGATDSPLHDALSNCQEASILLIDPMSPSVIKRARDIEMESDDYREQIYNSIQYLKNLKDNSRLHPKITLKMYHSYPFWKFIILRDHIWFQHYPEDNHVKNSPCFALKWNPEKPGLHAPFRQQFLLKWNSHRFGIYSFDDNMLNFYDDNGNHIPSRTKKII